jgi:adenine-specific DNA methylase
LFQAASLGFSYWREVIIQECVFKQESCCKLYKSEQALASSIRKQANLLSQNTLQKHTLLCNLLNVQNKKNIKEKKTREKRNHFNNVNIFQNTTCKRLITDEASPIQVTAFIQDHTSSWLTILNPKRHLNKGSGSKGMRVNVV